MEHDLELIIARLEILEIEVSNILYNSGNIEEKTLFNFFISWKSEFLNFLLPRKYMED